MRLRIVPAIDARSFVLAMIAGTFAVVPTERLAVHAQSWTPPYRMILTAERAMALVRAADRKLDYVPGEVLVKFKDGVSASQQTRALSALRSRPSARDLEWASGFALLRDSRELDATILAAQLSSQPEVLYAEPNYIYRAHVTPNDPGFDSLQWNLKTLDMPRAWDLNPGAASNLIVAVVDTGITTTNQSFPFQTWDGTTVQTIDVSFGTNPDLARSRLTGARDFVFWDGPVLDMVGHGTHVGSTIGENANNNLAEAGIAFNVNIMPVKACLGYWEIQFVLSASGFQGFAPPDLSICPSDAIARAIEYAADNGAKVINLSLGGAEPTLILQNALKYAVGKGSFVAIAVGNEHEEGNPVEYPAAYAREIDGVMSVGAVGPSLTRAYYSNTGSHLEISAPGGNHLEGGVSGMIWQTSLFPPDFDPATVLFPRFDRYAEVFKQGTSMATPHVSGTAALMISQGVTNPIAIEFLLKSTARDLGAPGRDSEYGFGLIQPRSALFGLGISR